MTNKTPRKFYTRFDPPMGSELNQEGQTSKVRQSEKDNCDINKIMERFNRTGQLPQVKQIPPRYGDAIPVDYATALNIVKESKDSFNQLPAKARQYFGHDPQNFMIALQDTSPENTKKLLELGILQIRKQTPEDTLQQIAENTKKPEEKPSGNSTPT